MAFSNLSGLVLASSSSYRAALMQRLGLAFERCAPEIDETPQPAEHPASIARRLAAAKARAVAGRYPDHLIVGSDQVATLDGVAPLGKPHDHAHAVEQLGILSGKRVSYFTAVCVLNSASDTLRAAMIPTEVEFRVLAPATIADYLERERPYDCTGSAKIEALGISLVRSVRSDDPTALIGLPLIALIDMLAAEGLRVV
jgi:septum formation protein